MKRVRTNENGTGSPGYTYKWFVCPGCGQHHYVTVVSPPDPKSPDGRTHPCWGWNGSDERPTFTPSYLERCRGYTCHSFIRDGRIQFLPDCTHALAGQTVDLPEVTEP